MRRIMAPHTLKVATMSTPGTGMANIAKAAAQV